ncbi:MAG: (2Fe-2S)-binding protein [Dehalococcoidales bacterium]|nr:(2Fe-2S)-binding protein [Dehalococcoidales bacterium]
MTEKNEKVEFGKILMDRITAAPCPEGEGGAGGVDTASPPFDAVQALSSTARTVGMTVNGRNYRLRIEPNQPLREVLRQELGLTSIKDFCSGYGACGSCTVLMNGRPVLSCMVLAAECDGAVIETVEGIADSGHPLIEAYIMNWAAQCGYCTPGFIVTAKALLDRNPNPTVDEIKEALAGNLCRCGTYPAHIKAVLEAARKLRREQ